jgi:hypothetical protein
MLRPLASILRLAQVFSCSLRYKLRSLNVHKESGHGFFAPRPPV